MQPLHRLELVHDIAHVTNNFEITLIERLKYTFSVESPLCAEAMAAMGDVSTVNGMVISNGLKVQKRVECRQ